MGDYRCSKCGNQVSSDTELCPTCGIPIRTTDETSEKIRNDNGFFKLSCKNIAIVFLFLLCAPLPFYLSSKSSFKYQINIGLLTFIGTLLVLLLIRKSFCRSLISFMVTSWFMLCFSCFLAISGLPGLITCIILFAAFLFFNFSRSFRVKLLNGFKIPSNYYSSIRVWIGVFCTFLIAVNLISIENGVIENIFSGEFRSTAAYNYLKNNDFIDDVFNSSSRSIPDLDYFPLSVGNTWTYYVTSDSSTWVPTLINVQVIKDNLVKTGETGQDYYIYQNNEIGIKKSTAGDTVFCEIKYKPFKPVFFPSLEPNTKQKTDFREILSHSSNCFHRFDSDKVEQTYQFVGFEDVEVPGGRFESSMKVNVSEVYFKDDKEIERDETYIWYAKNIGKIKEVKDGFLSLLVEFNTNEYNAFSESSSKESQTMKFVLEYNNFVRQIKYLSIKSEIADRNYNELREMYPVFHIVGEVQDYSSSAAQIWGKSFAMANFSDPIFQEFAHSEDTNILVLNPGPTFGDSYAGIHYAIRKDEGENLFGARVPVYVFGDLSEEAKSKMEHFQNEINSYSSTILDLESKADQLFDKVIETFVTEKIQNKSNLNDHGDLPDAPIIVAMNRNRIDLVELLLDNGADINIQDLTNSETVLIKSVKTRNTQLVDTLLTRNANLNLSDNNKNTALHIALLQEDYSLADLLIKRGTDINLKNNDSQTALHLATKAKNISLISLLIAKGADLNAQDNQGNTPLHYAGSLDKDYDPIGAEIGHLLISKGADYKIENKKGNAVDDYDSNEEYFLHKKEVETTSKEITVQVRELEPEFRFGMALSTIIYKAYSEVENSPYIQNLVINIERLSPDSGKRDKFGYIPESFEFIGQINLNYDQVTECRKYRSSNDYFLDRNIQLYYASSLRQIASGTPVNSPARQPSQQRTTTGSNNINKGDANTPDSSKIWTDENGKVHMASEAPEGVTTKDAKDIKLVNEGDHTK